MEEATCERIIKSVESIIRKDPELDEFDIIHSLGEVNKSPVVHIEHKLALESWCVKYVYKYAYSSVLHYHNTGGYQYAEPLLRWTQFCLLLMPDVATFWNIRKRMIRKRILTLDSELLLSRLVLTRKPKCMEAFQHRRWLFTSALAHTAAGESHNDLAFNNNLREPESVKQCLRRELDVCTYTATRKANNYHAWNHRLWVVEKLASLGGGDVEELYRSELEASRAWVSLHVSEHSGMHFRCKLLDAIAAASERGHLDLAAIASGLASLKDLFLRELKFNEALLESYPAHEALFYQRRVFLLRLQSLHGSHSGGQRASSSPPPLHPFKRSCIETLNAEWGAVLQREVEMAEEEDKCASEHSHHLRQQHLTWLNNVSAY